MLEEANRSPVAAPPGVVAVTGATGFIGTALVKRLLEHGHHVRAVGRSIGPEWIASICAAGEADSVKRLELQRGDLLDPSFVARCFSGAATLFHLAAEQSKRPATSDFGLITQNVRIAGSVATCAAASQIKSIVWASSALVYGTAARKARSEDSALRPETDYAIAKVVGESIASDTARAAGQKLSVLRIFNCYGVGQTDRSFLGHLISQALAGDVIEIQHLDAVRDFVHVDDILEGMLLASLCERDNILVNLGTGVGTSLHDVVEMFRSMLNREISVVVAGSSAPSEASNYLVADPRRAMDSLGWRPRWTFSEGLLYLMKRAGIARSV
jgi:nucleoside-diphosphate-sugar epimerase